MSSSSSRRLTWLLVFTAGLCLLPSSGILVASGLLNRASVLSLRAVAARQDWQTAERAWLDAASFDLNSPSLARGWGMMYAYWFEQQPERAGDARARLEIWASADPSRRQFIALLGDTLRAHALLEPAAQFYSVAQMPISTIDLEQRVALTRSGGQGELLDMGSAGNTNDTSSLNCEGCQLKRDAFLIGSNLYKLSFEGKSNAVGGTLHLTIIPNDRAAQAWRIDKDIRLDNRWQTRSETIWFAAYGSGMLHLTFESKSSIPISIRDIHFTKWDAPNNRLMNSGFEYRERVKNADAFPPWGPADFWNNLQADGSRGNAPGNQSDAALELSLTDAPAADYRIGVQQNCGNWKPNTRARLEADIQVPEDLRGDVAEVEAIFFQVENPKIYSAFSIEATQSAGGWIRRTGEGVTPAQAGRYGCVVVVRIRAQSSQHNLRAVARFDNLVLEEIGTPP